MSERVDIAACVPHAGSMVLLDTVEHWTPESIVCRSASHRRADHPLAHDGVLAAVHLIEYAAQAMALHAALLARGDGAAPPAGGVLAGVRDIRLHVERLDVLDAALEIHAERLIGNRESLLYRFSAQAAGRPLADGRIAVMTGASPESGA